MPTMPLGQFQALCSVDMLRLSFLSILGPPLEMRPGDLTDLILCD